jgi:hypothetical protein
MRVYVASLVDLENTVIVGVYTSKSLAVQKLEDVMDDLTERNEDLGVYSCITEMLIDDIDKEEYL